MAASFANLPRFFLPLAALIPLAVFAAPDPPPDEELEAASMEIDLRNNTFTGTDVSLKRGDVSIRADKAMGTGTKANLNDGPCTFSGNVIVTNPRGKLSADSATVTFREGRVVSAVIEGTKDAPAAFEHQLEEPEALARGHADIIEYDVSAETVRLRGDAWATNGREMDMRAELLVYDMRRQTLNAKSEEDGKRVRMTITPGAAEKKPPQ